MKVYFQLKNAAVTDKKTNTTVPIKVITAINHTGFSGPDFWYFPRHLRDLKHHSSSVQNKVKLHPDFTDTVHIPHTLSATDRKFYIFNTENESFYFKGTRLEKASKNEKKLKKRVSRK